MKFRTEIEIPRLPSHAQIGYENRILALGSCFAAEMSSRLERLHFHCTTNPTGTLFNPLSIAATLGRFAAPRPFDRSQLHLSNGLWHSFDLHGSLSDADADTALVHMNAALQAGTEALRNADRLLLTFGTAWVYERHGQVVANCHRRPAAEFTRRRLTCQQIVDNFSELLVGPLAGCEVILTVSPVRHLGDGLEGNALSKAVLRIAAAELAERHAQVRYFPAYEILTDDLRDYRFYADDLVHPSSQAVEYVWEKFSQAALSDRAQQTAQTVSEIVAAATHRPAHPDSETYRAFCRAQLARIATLPDVDFSEESLHFKAYLQ